MFSLVGFCLVFIFYFFVLNCSIPVRSFIVKSEEKEKTENRTDFTTCAITNRGTKTRKKKEEKWTLDVNRAHTFPFSLFSLGDPTASSCCSHGLLSKKHPWGWQLDFFFLYEMNL